MLSMVRSLRIGTLGIPPAADLEAADILMTIGRLVKSWVVVKAVRSSPNSDTMYEDQPARR